jgi:hypothetical protein
VSAISIVFKVVRRVKVLNPSFKRQGVRRGDAINID